jgi:hypothetical protein
MFKFEYIISKKFVFFPVLLLLSILCLGFFNSDWYSLIFYQLLFMLLYSSKLEIKKRNWALAAFIALFCIVLKNLIILPKITVSSNVFIGGKQIEESIFKKELPEKIFNKLDSDYEIAFPNSISAPDINLYDFSVSQLLGKIEGTKLVETINWKNRYQLLLGAFNNTYYNAYGQQQPPRNKLPFFVKYKFPQEYLNNDTKFCWKGLAYLGESLAEKKFLEIECIYLKDYAVNNDLNIWLLETGISPSLSAKLVLQKKYKIKIFIKNIITVLSSIIILFLLFKNIIAPKAYLFILSFFLSIVFSIYFYPEILNKFVLFEGGNDGLLYVHFAHLISDYIIQGNYLLAFRGGEAAYDLMPFYRYIWVINYMLFDEAPWMLYFIITFFPLVIYDLFKKLLNKKWAIIFLLFWFIVPIFEAFGFFHFYYVKLTFRGFGEPLSYLFFLTSLSFLINFYNNEKNISNTNSLLIGLLLSLAIGLRANILPACFILIFFFCLKSFSIPKLKNIIFLLLGLSLVLIIPIHNYIFTQKFIPLTIAAYKDWNLGARPSDYIELMLSIIKFDFNENLWEKIISHINGEIKLYEVWYHSSILSCIYVLFSKKIPQIIKCISLAALSLLGLLLFYHVGGRYSYLTWTLTLIVLSFILKKEIFPLMIKIRNKYAT